MWRKISSVWFRTNEAGGRQTGFLYLDQFSPSRMNIRAVAVGYSGAHFYIAAADATHTGEQVVAGFAPGQATFVFMLRGFVIGGQVGDVFVHGFVGVCFTHFTEQAFFADSCECVHCFFFLCFLYRVILPEKGSLYNRPPFWYRRDCSAIFTRTLFQCNVQYTAGRNGEFDSGVYFFYAFEGLYHYVFWIIESIFCVHFLGYDLSFDGFHFFTKDGSFDRVSMFQVVSQGEHGIAD